MTTIPHLHPHTGRNGITTWHWKPSPRLRKGGFTNVALGTDQRQAIMQAMDLNDKVAAWDAAGRQHLAQAPRPKRYTFGDLIDAYRQSEDFTRLATASRHEYDVRLRQLRLWAQDGTLPLAALNATMVRDLRDNMLAGGASMFKLGSLMRVLKLLLNWAGADGRQLVETNVAAKVRVRVAPSRGVVIQPDAAASAAAVAQAKGWPHVALAITMGLWTIQREHDLLELTRMNWREIEDCAAADRAALAGDDGRVMGFRLRQSKTGAWVDCPLPPWLHPVVREAFDRSQYLLADPADATRAMPEYILQRRWRAVRAECGLDHAQYRDLRRSGMVMLRDLGATLSGITTISGHMVMGKRTILDTYMPPDTRTACAAMATAVRTYTARQKPTNINVSRNCDGKSVATGITDNA